MKIETIKCRPIRIVMIAAVLTFATVSGYGLVTAAPSPPTGPSAISGVSPGQVVRPSTGSGVPTSPANIAPNDIRDIRGPVHIQTKWFWPLWLGSGLAAAALLYGGWRWSRRRARAAMLLPYQIALARLEKARALMHPEDAREFSIVISNVVREYIEERFTVQAARRTTEEFLRDLLEPSDVLLASHRESLGSFLWHCDLAKFARWTLSVEQMESMLHSAQGFVLETGTPPPAGDASATSPSVSATPQSAPKSTESTFNVASL